MSFSSLCIFWKTLTLILCLNELILFLDFKSEDRLLSYSIFLTPVGQAFLASVTFELRPSSGLKFNLTLVKNGTSL